MWLGSCVLTGSPNISRPAQDKPARAPTQSSETQEAADKSPSGQGDPQQTAKGERKEASGKSSSSPETSPQTAGNESQHAAETQPGAAQKDAASRPDSPGMADSKLAEARHNLQISEATENRIAAELEQLKNSGSATPETIKNYEDYHASVKEMVAENRRILARMEAAKARHSSAPTSSATTGRGEIEGMLNPEIPEAQTTDEVAALDRQLNASLGEFDTRLLEEMDQIRGQSAARMRDLAREAAEAAKRLREKGVDVNTSAAASSQTSEKKSTPAAKTAPAEQGAEGAKTASADDSRSDGDGSSGKKQERARSYEDDDIVARQLREAAENETDPELKEKLWKEYDDYKRNR